MRYHFTSTRMVNLKSVIMPSGGEDVGQLRTLNIAGGNVNWYHHSVVLTNLSYICSSTQQFHSGIFTHEKWKHILYKTYQLYVKTVNLYVEIHHRLIHNYFNWKQLKCTSTWGWLMNWCICMKENCWTIKR